MTNSSLAVGRGDRRKTADENLQHSDFGTLSLTRGFAFFGTKPARDESGIREHIWDASWLYSRHKRMAESFADDVEDAFCNGNAMV